VTKQQFTVCAKKFTEQEWNRLFDSRPNSFQPSIYKELDLARKAKNRLEETKSVPLQQIMVRDVDGTVASAWRCHE